VGQAGEEGIKIWGNKFLIFLISVCVWCVVVFSHFFPPFPLSLLQCDGSNGACWEYDSWSLSRDVFIASFVLKSLSSISFFLAYHNYHPASAEEDAAEADIKPGARGAGVAAGDGGGAGGGGGWGAGWDGTAGAGWASEADADKWEYVGEERGGRERSGFVWFIILFVSVFKFVFLVLCFCSLCSMHSVHAGCATHTTK
jgi:hypothetical protein